MLVPGRSYELYSPYCANALAIEACTADPISLTSKLRTMPRVDLTKHPSPVVGAVLINCVNTGHLAIGDAFRFVAKRRAPTGSRVATQLPPPPPCSDTVGDVFSISMDETSPLVHVDVGATPCNPLGIGDLHVIDSDDGRFQLTKIPDSWVAASETILGFGGLAQDILVCGKKNTGKSTFSRFLVNTLLNRCVLFQIFSLLTSALTRTTKGFRVSPTWTAISASRSSALLVVFP